MAITYVNIPTKAKWLSDSSVTLATRSKDVVLSRIDELVETYNNSPHTRTVTIADLYFTIDYWLKISPKNKLMEKGRTPAITALYKVVVDIMCYMCNCTINSLPRELELIFGREMDKHGVAADLIQKRARYMDSAEAEVYRLRFKNGKVYQYNWFEKDAKPKLVLANSSNSYFSVRRPGIGLSMENYSGFVMSMSRSFYMAKQVVGDQNSGAGIFHSSYLGDQAISSAGTMFIENGVIGGIRPDSGHFKPSDVNIMAALQALQMLGVNLGGIAIFTLDATAFATAKEFLTNHATREAFKQSRDKTLESNRGGYNARPKPDLGLFPTAADYRTGNFSPPPNLPPGFNPAAFKATSALRL